jgi:SAM-dependent methyltransferase
VSAAEEFTEFAVGAAPSAIGIAPDGKTAYVACLGTPRDPGTVVPISTATGTAGTPIKIPVAPWKWRSWRERGGAYAAGVEDDGVDWRALNRANWDSRVPVHLASSFYDLAGFRAGASTLRPLEISEVGPVAGLSLVHLQCHIGLDTLSWARRGAVVSGLDFSAPAIAAASSLSLDLGLPATFVVADVYDAVAAFGGQRFDIVYTGIGALVWLPDVSGWARVVAGLLAPGGFLYLVEGHPFAQILDSDACGLSVARDYFDASPQVDDYPYTYTSGPALSHPRQVEFQHGLGEIVTSLASAGLRIEFVHEFDFDLFQRFDSLQRREDGTYLLPTGQPRVPMMYSLRASLAAPQAG